MMWSVDACAQTEQATPNTAKGKVAEKYDTKLPVEISSDTLEVLQNQNKAIFKGNVIAVQGKIRLSSDVMIVHYKQKSDAPGQAAPPKVKSASSSQDGGSPMGAITLIEVEGNVFIATPEESAKGDKGNYQVEEKMLHLTGDNVILTRDKNILRGTELEYNLETGHSVLTSKHSKVRGTNGGRVHMLSVPNQDQSNSKKVDKDKGSGKPKEEDGKAADKAPPPPAVNTTP
jgi:lipopolysaccharide export system protein LptA